MKNRIFSSFLSRFSLQRFFDRDLSEDKSGLKYTRRGIEVVITGLTRHRGRYPVASVAKSLDFTGFFGYL